MEEPGKARLRLGRSLLGTAEKKKEGERTSEKTTASDAAKAGARLANFVETDADGASEASRQEKEKRWRLLAGSPQFQRRDWGTVGGHRSVVVSCSPVCTRNTKGPDEDRADSSMRIMHVVYTPALRARRELNAYTASDRQGRSKTEQANNVKVRPTPSVQRQRGKIDTS